MVARDLQYDSTGAHRVGIQAAIAAVSFSAGAHTPVLEDAHGELVRPAILWNDQRSGDESRELHEQCGARILELGLNRPAPTWTLPQFLWLTRNEPEAVKAWHASTWPRTGCALAHDRHLGDRSHGSGGHPAI